MLTLIVGIRNQGNEPIAEVHLREASHQVTLPTAMDPGGLGDTARGARPRDGVRIPSLGEQAPAGRQRTCAFEIGAIEVHRVEPTQYEGWTVAPGSIAFSHTGYPSDMPKTALASGLKVANFKCCAPARRSGAAPEAAARKTRLGEFQVLDFSEVRTPGTYTSARATLKRSPSGSAPACGTPPSKRP